MKKLEILIIIYNYLRNVKLFKINNLKMQNYKY